MGLINSNNFKVIYIIFISIGLLNCEAAIINVPGDFPNIQSALDSASDGDTVLVDIGIYHENLTFPVENIILKSSNGPQLTIIDGMMAGGVINVMSFHDENAVIDGFTIQNGSGTHFNGYYYGGGIFCSNSGNLIINNCSIVNNTADFGGGIACYNCDPSIKFCTIIENSALFSGGGGIFCQFSNAIIESNKINNNKSNMFGGGIFIYENGTPTIAYNEILNNETDGLGGGIRSTATPTPCVLNNIIMNNKATTGAGISFYDGEIINNYIAFNIAKQYWNSYLHGYGGGICTTGINPVIENNMISNNQAMSHGGGIVCDAVEGVISNNVIINNIANGGTVPSLKNEGGGIYFEYYSTDMTKVYNCILVNNCSGDRGGGVYLSDGSKATLINCTIVRNGSKLGSGVYCHSTIYQPYELIVINSILRDNHTDNIYYESDPPSISYTNIEGGFSGVGNIDADPLFVDTDAYDYHLQYISPCKDSGNNSAVMWNVDFEGDPRIVNGKVDMGADEFYTHLYYTGSTKPGQKITCKLIGMPNTNPVGLFWSLGIQNPPLKTMWGQFFLEWPLCELLLPPIPSTGVLSLSGRIPPCTPTPYDIPMQALLGLQSDSLTNLCIIEVR